MEHTLKVLLIEDNDGDAFLMKFYLGDSVSYKFEITHSKTLEDACNQMRSGSFDIVLMDLNLPDSIGLASIKKFIEEFDGSLVIVLTGLIDENVGFEAVKYGAQDFLVKGKFDSKLLISSIIFAYERFKLNKTVKTVTEELLSGQYRFENLQRLTNVGYFEFNFKTNKLYMSKFAAEKLGFGTTQEITLQETLEKLTDEASQNAILTDIANGKKEGSGAYENKILGIKVHTKWKVVNDVFISAVYYD